ncbi:bacterioferritin comigratory protein [Vibrio parahaemolyticus]|uniref:bacterioferritin comigratory protein n=1 Tax=Vibrio TaxID=662 RepID=UPI00084B2B01|nr:bacterioferritin comigratory protein [Vibrio parahaemolyticus]EGR0744802.1 bacterioferritin comigratory protein [Vibrio parahaemolyticus]EGR1181091.1 bacterioferritin comigratory protein [Vibrio parahaemolyticus]EGR2223220.1 bacterioferritin comigratory protein [Vibrio parahaemolyticus]EGR3029632.1 bacterioferritin comigratory protein [Vibrio parahaemolyticus]EHO8532247.1 bacterioferritin comigratory protein [Vibrio parahaemolyticus]
MSQITKNKLIKALERLLDGNVAKLTSRELRNKARKGKIKINNSNVEKEAGLSAGALRRHNDVVLMIKNKSLEVQVAQDETADSPIEVLQKEIKALKGERAQANKKKKEYYDEAQSHKEALAVQAATHIKVVQELMEMLHESQREKAMDKVVNASTDNIVEGNFRK